MLIIYIYYNLEIYIYIYIFIFQTNKVCLKANILGETSQRRSAPVTKFSQLGAWISLKRANAASQSTWCCVFPFFTSIIFKSIIQFLFAWYFHYYCVCTNSLSLNLDFTWYHRAFEKIGQIWYLLAYICIF